MNLLIVNDMEPIMRFLADEIAWERHGISSVFRAYSANEARGILSENHIDLLLCDIQMPGENGLGLVRWVVDSGMDVDCVFLTCYANFDYAKEAINLGCLDYILFPAKADDIGCAVQVAIDKRAAQKEKDRLSQFGQYWIDSRRMPDMDAGMQAAKTPRTVVDEAIDYIMQNLSAEISITEMAKRNYLSPCYFSRLFKKHIGLSISQFIIREKMQLAAELLVKTNMPISAIASKTGYDNYSHFTATFKKAFAKTPSEYRNLY
jgi:YesN/AraC family two-component response regulator